MQCNVFIQYNVLFLQPLPIRIIKNKSVEVRAVSCDNNMLFLGLSSSLFHCWPAFAGLVTKAKEGKRDHSVCFIQASEVL
jgi:hypothetical protein